MISGVYSSKCGVLQKGQTLNSKASSAGVVLTILAGTSFIPEGISEEQNNKKDSGIEAVPTVPAVPDTVRELSIDYEQLSCVFCGRVIMDNDWTQDDFTWNKPAHKKCYDDKKADLKQEGL